MKGQPPPLKTLPDLSKQVSFFSILSRNISILNSFGLAVAAVANEFEEMAFDLEFGFLGQPMLQFTEIAVGKVHYPATLRAKTT